MEKLAAYIHASARFNMLATAAIITLGFSIIALSLVERTDPDWGITAALFAIFSSFLGTLALMADLHPGCPIGAFFRRVAITLFVVQGLLLIAVITVFLLK